MHLTKFLRAVLLAVACSVSLAVAAQTGEAQRINIPAGNLTDALDELARQTGAEFIYRSDQLKDVHTQRVQGMLSADEALNRLLEDSGFTTRRDPSGAILIVRSSAAPHSKQQTKPLQQESEAQREPVKDLDEIVVVGSRLGVGSPVESALPIRLITREDIDRSGANSISQVLINLPEVSVNNAGDGRIGTGGGNLGGALLNASNVQMRGLPVGTTLILINGRRAGGSSAFTNGMFDLSTIPLSLVERIEVLPAGASAVYGGEGLAGVVNVVLRKDASGLEVRARNTFASKYGESSASAVFGKAWSRGRVNVTATWRKTGGLSNAERALTSDHDYTRFGGQDYRWSVSNPGNVYSLEGCPPLPNSCRLVPLEDRGNLPGLDSPYAGVPEGVDGEDLIPGDFVDTSGQLNHESLRTYFFSPEESYALTLDGSADISDNLQVFTELMYSKRRVDPRELYINIGNGHYSGSSIVSAENPFNPFGVDVGVDYRFDNTGLYREFSQSNWRALAGIRGAIRSWEWEVAGWRSRDVSDSGDISGFDPTAIAAALRSSDPSTALNPFVGNGSSPGSEELMRSMLYPISDGFSTSVTALNGYAKGRLVNLPAGDLMALVGAEYQRQDLSWNHSASFILPVVGRDRSRAVFGEFRAPIIGAGKDIHGDRLALSGAFRRESTDRFDDNAMTRTFALEVRPTKSLLLRGSYSTAFKPLALWSAVRKPSHAANVLNDPAFGGEMFFIDTIYSGGVPDHMRPETSASRTLGFVYTTPGGGRLSLSHLDMKVRDRYSSIGPQLIVENEDYYPGRVTRDPDSGVVTLVDVRPVNISEISVSAIDMSIEDDWLTRWGDVWASLAATYTYTHEEKLTPDSPVTDNLARWARSSWSPRWKVVPRIGWSLQDRLNVSVAGRYISSYVDPTALSSGPNAGKYVSLGDFWIFDMNFDTDIRPLFGDYLSRVSTARMSLGVNNVLNKLPDFCPSCGVTGYDASQYDIVGRSVYAEIRVGF